MTRKQMKDEVIRWLGLQDITDWDETAMIDDKLYQGTLDLLSRTRCTVRCVNLHVNANVSQYTLDHAVLSLVDVENGARPRTRRDDTTGPSFTLIRSDVLVIKPTPAVNGTVQVWAVMRPVQMTADTDSPADEAHGAIPDEFHDAIVTYALWKLADYADDSSANQGERYRMLYEGQDGRGGRLTQIKVMVNKRGTATLPRRKITLAAPAPQGYWTG